MDNEDKYLDECADILTEIYIRITSNVFIPVPDHYLILESKATNNDIAYEDTEPENKYYRERSKEMSDSLSKTLGKFSSDFTDIEKERLRKSLTRLQYNNFKNVDEKRKEDPSIPRTRVNNTFLKLHYIRKAFKMKMEKLKADRDSGKISQSVFDRMKTNFLGCLTFLANPQNWRRVIRRLKRSNRPFSDLFNIAMEVRGAELKAEARKISNIKTNNGERFFKDNEEEYEDGLPASKKYYFGSIRPGNRDDRLRDYGQFRIASKYIYGNRLQQAAEANRTSPRKKSKT